MKKLSLCLDGDLPLKKKMIGPLFYIDMSSVQGVYDYHYDNVIILNTIYSLWSTNFVKSSPIIR